MNTSLFINKSAKVGVIGLGYVGLPFSCIIADAGFKVFGIDIKEENIKKINNGISPIVEPKLPELLKNVVKKGNLTAGTDYSILKGCDVIIICVQTPLINKTPYFEYLKNAAESISKNIKDDVLIVIESTIAPGTTDNIVKPILEKSEKKFYLAHSPERVLPGKLIYELIHNNRVIGGINNESSYLAKEFYSQFVKGTIITTSSKIAEMTKVAENTFRDINIAYANELAKACEELKINVYEVIKYANMHPRVNIHNPGGVGGHCLPKDPWLLIYSVNKDLRLIEEARRVNDNMVKHMINLMHIGENKLNINIKKAAVLGLAYKGDIDDTRNSPGRALKKELENKGIFASVYDPYVKGNYEDAVKNADVIFICTNHSEFKNINLDELKELMNNPIIVDGRNIIDKKKSEENGFIYLGVGNI